MYGFEKKGGLPREEKRMEAFRNVLEDCQLMDVGYSGNWFTGVANVNWISRFPETTIKHLVHSTSNHCPLLITTTNEGDTNRWETFRFEAWWFLEESFESIVKAKWESATGNLLQKLEYIKSELGKWAAQTKHSRNCKKKFFSSKLADLIEAERTDTNLEELIDTKLQLNFEIDKDERY
ncbi:reverse transcriptase [Gossypium australe]|uniref:Reverse transcriptase n=1 Tax=Gossypium australe TaxID=47621 RepID=A0A5B6WBL4_9ROSI|nr:reverse transcriptase [Gossypium australe]